MSEFEAKVETLLEEVSRHPLKRANEAGAVLVSAHLHLCCEVYKRQYNTDPVPAEYTIETIHGIPLVRCDDYAEDEWYVLDREEWAQAVTAGEVWRATPEVPGASR